MAAQSSASTIQPDTVSATTIETVERFNDAFNQHDVNEVMALMTEDCVFENTYPPPDGMRLSGQAAVRAYWEEFFRESPQAHFVVEDLFASSERGALRWRYSWLDAQGHQGHVRGVDIFRVRDAKVAEKLSYVKG